jgi:HSP20 family protein
MMQRNEKGEIVARHPETEVTFPGVWRSFQEFDRMFDELRWEMDASFGGWGLPALGSFSRTSLGGSPWRTPRVDIGDRGTHYVVQAEVPGVPKERIQVDVDEDRLEIRAEHSVEKQEEKEGARYREIGRSAFYRAIPLPEDADPDKVEARLENGMLTVTLGKHEAAPKGKRVDVK